MITLVSRVLLTILPTSLRCLRIFGLSGVSPGCCCVGSACTVDYSSGSSAGPAQCCRCGGFFPSFAIFALVWGLLFFLRNFASIPRLRFWCGLFCSLCLFSASLSPTVARLVCFSCRAPSLVVPVDVCSVYLFISLAAELCLLPLLLLGVG